jgi:hypothetical protein
LNVVGQPIEDERGERDQERGGLEAKANLGWTGHQEDSAGIFTGFPEDSPMRRIKKGVEVANLATTAMVNRWMGGGCGGGG